IPNPADPPSPTAVLSDIDSFTVFMRMLAAPQPAAPTAVTQHGSNVFASIGCALCHTPALATSVTSTTRGLPNPALSNKSVPLYSDLLVHHMGAGLADGITQGAAGPDEFRTAPLWGLGQRVFFLHDGRTSDLIQVIRAHASSGSEANQAVLSYAALSPSDQQALINFLRSL
ncbi:MAG TPA: di-heme oxidoredictase family protein, partial [Steroidobacteraceae bacterium]